MSGPAPGLSSPGSMHLLHWGVVGTSVLLTVAAWQFSQRQLDDRVQERFSREANQVEALVRERMELYENALRGGVSFLDANGGEVRHAEWARYAGRLHLEGVYPGINGIGVIKYVPEARLEDYLAAERRDRPEFGIHPEHARGEYWPITLIEPVQDNRAAVGLDMAFEDNRYSAALRARDTGRAQVTGPIVLVQDAQKTPGFLLFVPYYRGGGVPATEAERRERVLGLCYAPFIVDKLMQGTLAQQERQISLRIVDGDETLFDDADDGSEGLDPDPLFTRVDDLEVYGRTWRFEFRSNLGFRATQSSAQPVLILGGGLLIDALLFTIFVILTRANRRAVDYAGRVTARLRQRGVELERRNRELDHFTYVASHDLKAPLRAIRQLTSWIQRDLGDSLQGDGKRWFTTLEQRVRRLERLLEDLLAYARIGHQEREVAYERLELQELVREAVVDLEIPPEFEVHCAADLPAVEAPRGSLSQILRNALQNAIKHHDRGRGRIEVGAVEEAAQWRLWIQDDGPGIPPELRERALEPFKTLRPRDQVEGSGMGLAILKRVVEARGGEVTLDGPSEGRGLVVSFTWPRTPHEQHAGAEEAP